MLYTKKNRILIIDDNVEIKVVFSRIFKQEKDYELFFASNVDEALSLLNEHKPDIILLDIVMPGMDGYDFAELIKSKPKINDVPIIFITGRTDLESRLLAFEKGGVDYICKPFSPVELLARIKVHIKIRKMTAELKLKNELLSKREKHLRHIVDERTCQLKKQLYTDSLTDYPNRLQLLSDIQSSEKPILILINIDSFKEINSFYGHIIGDYILIELGSRLKIVTDKYECKLYKLHADEFAVLVDYKMTTEVLINFVQELHDTGELKPYTLKPYFGEDHKIILDISLGVSSNHEKTNILENADMALKFSKRKRAHWLFYDKSMTIMKEYGDNIKWTRIIKNAIKGNRIVTHFQPIYNNTNKNLEKYEALVRLINESGNIILPETFLYVAKKSKQYEHITKTVIREVFQYFKNKDTEFSINLSVEDILNPDTVNFINHYLCNYNLGEQVVLEILESEGIERYEEVSKFIKMVKKKGCKIAIDDFGAGYSNFDHILKLNVDYIKIDASLIENIDKDRNSQIIVETIVDFCNKLKISTIAEKVHSKTVFDMVVNLGVCYSQGFYLGKPTALFI